MQMQLANSALSCNFADANTLPQYPFFAYLGDPFKLKPSSLQLFRE